MLSYAVSSSLHKVSLYKATPFVANLGVAVPENVSFAEFDTDGYKIAVCTKDEEKDFEFKELNLSKILIK